MSAGSEKLHGRGSAMSDLLDRAIEARGGLVRWHGVRAIDASARRQWRHGCHDPGRAVALPSLEGR